MNMEDEEEYQDDDEDESEGIMLRIGEDGKADIYKPEDYVEMTKEDAELIKRFIDENKELFKKYCEKHKAHEKTE